MLKSRVADSCWAVGRKDVFKVSDDECKAALATLDEVEAKNGNIAPFLWVGKCWAIITVDVSVDFTQSHHPLTTKYLYHNNYLCVRDFLPSYKKFNFL